MKERIFGVVVMAVLFLFNAGITVLLESTNTSHGLRSCAWAMTGWAGGALSIMSLYAYAENKDQQ